VNTITELLPSALTHAIVQRAENGRPLMRWSVIEDFGCPQGWRSGGHTVGCTLFESLAVRSVSVAVATSKIANCADHTAVVPRRRAAPVREVSCR
jgi:hypothetical protein